MENLQYFESTLEVFFVYVDRQFGAELSRGCLSASIYEHITVHQKQKEGFILSIQNSLFQKVKRGAVNLVMMQRYNAYQCMKSEQKEVFVFGVNCEDGHLKY